MNEQLKIIISAEVSKLKQATDTAKKHIKGFKEQVAKAQKDVDSKIKSIGTGLTNAAKSMGVGLAAVSGALLALGGSTEEYRNQQAQLITAFEAAGASAETAKGVYNDLYRVLGDSGQAQEAAQHLAKLTTEEKALSEWTTITQGVYATFGASLPIEGLTEAANHTAKLGEVQGVLADALEWSGINVESYNEQLAACNTEAEREALIRETLSGLYSEAAATYEANNAQVLAQRDAQAALQEKLAALGETLAPVITAFTNFASNALALVVPHIQSLAEQYLPLLESVLGTVSETLGTVMGYITDNWTTITAIAGVIGGIATAIGLYNTVAAVKAAMAAVEVTTVWGLVSAYAAQAVAVVAAIAPYVAIVAAIAAVVAAIVYCVKHWDEIKAKIKEVWAAIKEWTAEAVEKIKQYIQDMVDKVANFFTNMKTKISEQVSAAKETAVNTFENLRTGITNKMELAKTAIANTITNITNSMRDKFNAAKTTVTNIFENIKSGIQNKIDAAKTGVSNAIEKIKSVMDFSWELPKIKLPHFSISGKFSLNPPSIPKFSVSWYKLGGVFDNATLFPYGGGRIGGLGENGAEAIVPLERNTEWMNKLANMLSERMGTNQPIVLEVDGKTFAQISVDSINQLTKQRGSIPLKLA